MKPNAFLLLLLTSLISNKSIGAVFNIPNGDIAAFIAAIDVANASNGADTINLAANGSYNFSSWHSEVVLGNAPKGYVALPQIRNSDPIWDTPNTLDLVINGNGARLIRNSSQNFRFFYVHIYAKVEFKNMVFSDGRGRYRGGAIYGGWRTHIDIDNCEFLNNETFDDEANFSQGGGAVMISSESELSITGSIFTNNAARDFSNSASGNGGGAVMCLLSDLIISGCDFENNYSSNMGGAVYTDGAKYNNGSFRISNSKFISNSAERGSGALLLYSYNNNYSLVENCHFEQNHAHTNNGGALYSGAGSISHSGYSNIPNQTEVEIRNSSFINNSSASAAGALFINENHSKLINCTVALNSAPNLASALFIGANRLSFQMENLSIAENSSSGTARGIFVGGASTANLAVKNTIITNNQNGNLHSMTSGHWNVTGANIQFPNNDFGNNSFIIANPLLLAPDFNGADTKTMALQASSPAIDAGIDCPATDQRGAARVGPCDIGAYEFDAALPSTIEPTRVEQLRVFPNPSSTKRVFVEIPTTAAAGQYEITILNALGATLSTKTMQATSQTLELDFKPFAAGLYFIQMRMHTSIHIAKVIIID